MYALVAVGNQLGNAQVPSEVLLVFVFDDQVPLVSRQRTELPAWRAARRKRFGCFEVRSLEPTRPLTEAEKVERYRTGRFAEMPEVQAGL